MDAKAWITSVATGEVLEVLEVTRKGAYYTAQAASKSAGCPNGTRWHDGKGRNDRKRERGEVVSDYRDWNGKRYHFTEAYTN